MNILENINKTIVPEMNWDDQKNISYTQFSLWSECPHKWKLMYIDKLKQPPSIFLSFGSAMHETIQEYLAMHFKVSIREAYDYLKILDKKTINNIVKNYKWNSQKKTIKQ